jgi:hypothetical protein
MKLNEGDPVLDDDLDGSVFGIAFIQVKAAASEANRHPQQKGCAVLGVSDAVKHCEEIRRPDQMTPGHDLSPRAGQNL